MSKSKGIKLIYDPPLSPLRWARFLPVWTGEMWWLILWPLISHRSYIGFRHWQSVFVARIYSHCNRSHHTHVFRELFSLHPYKRAKLLFLYVPHCQFSLGQSQLSRPALLLHLHSCPSLALWSRPVNQEVLSVTSLCRTEPSYGQHECTQLTLQASRQMDLFSTNTLFPVEQPEDSKECCWPRRIS